MDLDFLIDFFSPPEDIYHYFLVEGISETEEDCILFIES
jgi:hypothetical protein